MTFDEAEAKKTGVLIVNLGSPNKLTTSAVRRFLKEFLWDPRVVNIPRPVWWFILNFLVLPFRPRKAKKAYKKIWQTEGSPLIVFSKRLTDRVAKRVDSKRYLVDSVMRYGQPSIEKQLRKYQKESIHQLIVIPLYPQYSSTTTASVYDEVVRCISQWRYIPAIRFLNEYHQHHLYISAICDSIEQAWKENGKQQLLLMSFHGLPEKLTEWGDPYFFHCQATAKLIAQQLSLTDQQWKMVFQSRFGKAKWLQPYCVDTLQELPSAGIKNIDVICPGFAVDCLETLEEIEQENKQVFIQSGGQTYHYIPALNDSEKHVELMVGLIEKG